MGDLHRIEPLEKLMSLLSQFSGLITAVTADITIIKLTTH